jgi:RNA polymerase sigma factor for flagellar operon FliA
MYAQAYKRTAVDDREEILTEFLPIIKHLAYKFIRGFDDDTLIEDLISAGVVGLLEAMDKYNAVRGTKLNTFAYLRIRGAMVDELRKRDWFPRRARAKAKKVEAAIRELERKLGRYPTEEEVSQELHMDVEQYLDMVKDLGSLSVVSIDEIAESSGIGREGIISMIMEDGASPETCAELGDIQHMLSTEIERLPEKQKIVLSLYYYEDMNYKEIGHVLGGVTEARVSQIHTQAMISLRAIMKARLEEEHT